MKTLFFFLLVISCSSAPKTRPASHEAKAEQMPEVMEGVSVVKRTFFEVKGAYNLLRNTKEATLSIWAKPAELGENYQNIVSFSVGGKQETWKSRASITMSPKGELEISARAQDHEDKSEVRTMPGILTLNEWQHIAVTIDYSKKKMQFYLNGEKVPTASEFYKFMTPETADTASNRCAMGAEDDGSGGYYSGKLTGLRVQRSVLSEDEIRKAMEETRP